MKNFTMTAIHPEKFYSTQEVVNLGREDLFPIRTMVTLQTHIKQKKIQVVNIGTKKKPIYRIQGNSLLDFINNGQLRLPQKKRTRSKKK